MIQESTKPGERERERERYATFVLKSKSEISPHSWHNSSHQKIEFLKKVKHSIDK